MSKYIESEQKDGSIIVSSDSKSLVFENRQIYVEWQRTFLICNFHNGDSPLCFVLFPPQKPFNGESSPRM